MNRDIFMLDHIAEQVESERIEEEEMDISHLPDDDDYGEEDGDEGY